MGCLLGSPSNKGKKDMFRKSPTVRDSPVATISFAASFGPLKDIIMVRDVFKGISLSIIIFVYSRIKAIRQGLLRLPSKAISCFCIYIGYIVIRDFVVPLSLRED